MTGKLCFGVEQGDDEGAVVAGRVVSEAMNAGNVRARRYSFPY